MSWLIFAFSGPVLWAVSTHMDKYLVERYFKDSNVAVLLIFTALIGLFTLPFIWWFAPAVAAVGLANAALMAFSGVLYMGAMLFYLRALQSKEASVVRRSSRPLRCSASGWATWCWARPCRRPRWRAAP
jgi:drug/metabolite transporter (DMT)-like permease